MQRINSYIHEKNIPGYLINLDPAVAEVPYNVNIDISDTVNYKKVMKEYKLGPNGAILTSLNLFATRFDQVLTILEKKNDISHIFVDTPGQIEIFTWSASGQIISESLASSFPTVMIYVVDTPRNSSPVTFMSNMLYACSILYKSRLPLILVFNKIDVIKHDFALKWMNDYDEFQDALQSEKSYSSSLASSMGLVLQEFYNNLTSVGISAVTGEGFDDLFVAIEKSAEEYEKDYKPEFEKNQKERLAKENKRKEDMIKKFGKDRKEDRDDDIIEDDIEEINME
jgi:GTPase SAR1 family protein